MYSIQEIAGVIKGTFLIQHHNDAIEHLVYDSRRIMLAATSVFFALKSEHNNGHHFIADAYKKGIRNFIVSESVPLLPESSIILVENTLNAMQELVSFHRQHFSIPVVGITGSNGKTMVKEWLNYLLQDAYVIVRSPRSFNSQIGVPLSVWQLQREHTLALFEAGISRPGEMKKLYEIIRPTIGVLTNIGEAHSEGFEDVTQKINEKLELFQTANVLIYHADPIQVHERIQHWYDQRVRKQHPVLKLFSWSATGPAHFKITNIEKKAGSTRIEGHTTDQSLSFEIPLSDNASVENAITSCCVMLELQCSPELIRKRMAGLHAIDMRLQLKHSFNDCLVINDSYSNDLTSLRIALDFLNQQGAGLKRTVILSEFFESSRPDEALYQEISQLFRSYRITRAVVIGEKIAAYFLGHVEAGLSVQTYLSTDDFLKDFRSSVFFHEIILIKGARKFEFERIAQAFEKKLHQTVLEINLDALSNNFKHYQKLLKPGTRIMAMVKAFSYGSGGAEIASVLQYHNADYLGVAYADEGVELVKAGIRLPVMVMNAEVSSFRALIDYHLEPVIYSFELLYHFESYLKDQGLSQYPIHLELETGMNRLGFTLEETDHLAQHLAASNLFQLRSVFTHLAASEEAAQDGFTQQQANLFRGSVELLEKYIPYFFLKHISNSAAIVRHPDLQMDMVRLGIGLYGVEMDHPLLSGLKAVATLRSNIAQLKKVKKGDSVSYNRKGIVTRDSVIATVRIGYADGYSRRFGNGNGKMWVKGKLVAVIGTVCMDMTMIDVTDVEGVSEGDDVILFGPELPVQKIAKWIDTISYEIMTGISQRVKRIYFHE